MSSVREQADNFINVPFTLANLDLYIVRSAILKALRSNLQYFQGNLLDIGCGKMPYKSFIKENSRIENYVGLDIETAIEYDPNIKPDFTWDGITMPFEDESYESIMATEVLEHCPDPRIILNEVYRVLKPQGVFFFTTPFLWNLHEVPHDEYRFTPFSLRRHLESAGFRRIDINASGGWHASLAQMLGLWVRRSNLPGRKRKYLSVMLRPIIKKLLAWDAKTKIQFDKGPMITTLYGTARK